MKVIALRPTEKVSMLFQYVGTTYALLNQWVMREQHLAGTQDVYKATVSHTVYGINNDYRYKVIEHGGYATPTVIDNRLFLRIYVGVYDPFTGEKIIDWQESCSDEQYEQRKQKGVRYVLGSIERVRLICNDKHVVAAGKHGTAAAARSIVMDDYKIVAATAAKIYVIDLD